MIWFDENSLDIRKEVRHAMFSALDGKATKLYIGNRAYLIAPVYDKTKDADSKRIVGVGITDGTADLGKLCVIASIDLAITEMIDILVEGIYKDFVAKEWIK